MQYSGKGLCIPKGAYEDQIDRAAKNIRNTDCVIIGAGAGASTAAGIQYGGKRFTDNFAEFIKKYGEYYMTDMYAAGFYPYRQSGDTGQNMH